MAYLNEKIVAYLNINNISFITNDYQTGQPEGQEDQVLHWDSKLGAQPTQEQLDSAWATKLTQDDAVAYKAKRVAEYPSIADQLDLLYHGGIDGWKTVIQAVKDKYPKG
jgi:hypothetical protein